MFDTMINQPRSPRQSTASSRSNVVSKFVCKFCHKQMVREAAYLVHHCKQMKRYEEFQSPIGQAAVGYYQRWMRVQKRNPPAPTTFLTSNYFRTFINFANFVAKVSLPKPDKFIWLMNEKKYPPTMWTNDEAYTQYLEYLDRKALPLDQVNLSVETLMNVADENDVDVADVFNVIQPMALIHLIRTRQLSPWLLLHSTKFKLFFRDKMTPEQHIVLEALVDPGYWSEQFEKHEKDLPTIYQYIKEMNI